MTQHKASNTDTLKQLRAHAKKLRAVALKLGRERRQTMLEIVEDFERLIDEITIVLSSKATEGRAKGGARVKKPLP